MISLEQFKDNAKKHGICDMLKDWENARSKKQLMDVALSIRGIEYLCNAIAQGWGISPEVIAEEFAPFNNGRYVRDKDGYTSCMYCRPEEDIHVTTTAALIIDCKKEIIIDKPVCEIYLVDSKVKITGEGRAKVYLYNSEITNNPTAPAITIERN